MIWIIICSSCMFGRIGQEATKKTPKMCRAYMAAAARIRPAARSLADAIKREDVVAVNRFLPQLKKMMDALVPALMKTYDKEALETMWSEVEGALYRQRDVDTPAFLRELQTCTKPVDIAFALRPTAMIPSQPLPPPTVLMAPGVQDKDLMLSEANIVDTVGSKIAGLFAASLGEGFGDVNTLPDHETPLSVVRQTKKWLRPRDCGTSLMCSRSGHAYAIDPVTKEILFSTERRDSGHARLDAADIQRCAVEVGTSGAYLNLCQLANADRDALLEAAVEEDNKRTSHADKVESCLDEAYASGASPNIVVFLAQAGDAVAKGRAFANRDALEEVFASIGAPCLPLLESDGGLHGDSSISDLDQYLYDVLPPNLRVNRHRVVLVFPCQHVYPQKPRGMGHHLAAYLAREGRVFSEAIADAASVDVTILDDLDSAQLDPYRAYVKADEAFLTKWRADRSHTGGSEPSVMLNEGFISKEDVSRAAAEKRKAELDKVVGPGDFGSRDKKEPYDYESYLKPGGVWDVARLEALQKDFEGQLERYQLAVSAKAKIPRNFWDWRGAAEQSQDNLRGTLNLQKKPQGGASKRMTAYAHHLGEKIEELKASAAG